MYLLVLLSTLSELQEAVQWVVHCKTKTVGHQESALSDVKWNRNGELQASYYPDNGPDHPGHFKGMATLLEEQGLMLKDSKHSARLPLLIAMTPLQLVNAVVTRFYTMSLILHSRKVVYRS